MKTPTVMNNLAVVSYAQQLLSRRCSRRYCKRVKEMSLPTVLIALMIPSVSIGQESTNTIITVQQVNQIHMNVLGHCEETVEIANIIIGTSEFTAATNVLSECTLFSSHANHLLDILEIRDDVVETGDAAGPAERIKAVIDSRIPRLRQNFEAVGTQLLNIEVYNKNLALDGKLKAFRRELQRLIRQLENYSFN